MALPGGAQQCMGAAEPEQRGGEREGEGERGRARLSAPSACDRSRVWAEPCLLPTATSKLSGAVEQWLSAAERLYGPYMWGRYVLGAAVGHRGQRETRPHTPEQRGAFGHLGSRRGS